MKHDVGRPGKIVGSEQGPVVYAIADVHLGLRQGGHHDEPAKVGAFFRWLSRLRAGEEIPVLDGDRVALRPLRPPTHLVLVGDILELWDGENTAILTSAIPVAGALAEVNARKVYVLGNHDNVLEGQTGAYPLGAPDLTIVRDVYPEPVDGIVTPLRVGSWGFIFAHGHQFNRTFVATEALWKILPLFRQFGAALGDYSLVVSFGLAVSALILALAVPSWWGWLLFAGLVFASVPRFYMRIARPLWAAFAPGKYNRDAALSGLQRWWGKFRKSVGPEENIGIVYGHTHILDWLDVARRTGPPRGGRGAEERLVDFLGGLEPRRHALYNVSAWIRAPRKFEDIIRATIFYADTDGPKFLGWNWDLEHPFHIPFPFIRKMALGSRLSDDEVAKAREMGWPEAIVRKWGQETELRRSRRRLATK